MGVDLFCRTISKITAQAQLCYVELVLLSLLIITHQTPKPQTVMVILRSEAQVRSFFKRKNAKCKLSVTTDIGSSWVEGETLNLIDDKVIINHYVTIWWDNYKVNPEIIAVIRLKKPKSKKYCGFTECCLR